MLLSSSSSSTRPQPLAVSALTGKPQRRAPPSVWDSPLASPISPAANKVQEALDEHLARLRAAAADDPSSLSFAQQQQQQSVAAWSSLLATLQRHQHDYPSFTQYLANDPVRHGLLDFLHPRVVATALTWLDTDRYEVKPRRGVPYSPSNDSDLLDTEHDEHEVQADGDRNGIPYQPQPPLVLNVPSLPLQPQQQPKRASFFKRLFKKKKSSNKASVNPVLKHTAAEDAAAGSITSPLTVLSPAPSSSTAAAAAAEGALSPVVLAVPPVSPASTTSLKTARTATTLSSLASSQLNPHQHQHQSQHPLGDYPSHYIERLALYLSTTTSAPSFYLQLLSVTSHFVFQCYTALLSTRSRDLPHQQQLLDGVLKVLLMFPAPALVSNSSSNSTTSDPVRLFDRFVTLAIDLIGQQQQQQRQSQQQHQHQPEQHLAILVMSHLSAIAPTAPTSSQVAIVHLLALLTVIQTRSQSGWTMNVCDQAVRNVALQLRTLATTNQPIASARPAAWAHDVVLLLNHPRSLYPNLVGLIVCATCDVKGLNLHDGELIDLRDRLNHLFGILIKTN